MYDIVDIEVVGDVRVGDPFLLNVVVDCIGDDCPEADAVVMIDGEIVATKGVDLPAGNRIDVSPPTDGFGPALTAADWIDVGEDGALVVHDPGRHTLVVKVADQREEIDLVVGPDRGEVKSGEPVPDGGIDG